MTRRVLKRKEKLVKMLMECTSEERQIFVRMYGPKECVLDPDGFMFNRKAIADNNIHVVVENIASRKLEWAITQVQNTLNHKEGK